MRLLFTLTLILSAALLFWVQPLIAKMILPLFGGTPGVWNASMVFFQTILLLGYLYSHLISGNLTLKRQVAVHFVLVIMAGLVLPISISATYSPPVSANPTGWIILLLLFTVGLPAFVISSTAPLLQRWFSHSGHRDSRDPYFLYSASNLGSMAALAGFPLLIEPSLRLSTQSKVWAGTYALLAILLAACAVLVWRRRLDGDPSATLATPAEDAAPLPPTARLRIRWFLLALVPSSLLLGVTTHITTDIASVPLLWIIPLSLYLLSFIVVFARRRIIPHGWVIALETVAVLSLAYIFAMGSESDITTFPIHLLAFFAIALVCHGELALHRPSAAYLTDFYLWMSIGGVAGGILNTLAAPMLFRGVWEYPLMVVLACALRPSDSRNRGRFNAAWFDVLFPAALLIALSVSIPLLKRALDIMSFLLGLKALFAVAAVVVFFMRRRPIRFCLGMAVLIVSGLLFIGRPGDLLYRTRNFFGVITVSGSQGRFNTFVHGRTVHGAQSLDATQRREPLTYYSRTGPLGQVFASSTGRYSRNRIGVIGLGIGSAAAYGQPGQHMTFYEIDPDVERVARDPRYFTFLQDSAAQVDVVIGDARLTLEKAPDGSFNMLIVDAFSSDSVPVHIITREALTLYLQKLAPGGLLVFNISNQYLALEPVLANIARELKILSITQEDSTVTIVDEIRNLKSRSTWVVMARSPDDMGLLPMSGRWRYSAVDSAKSVWTDDFSNIVEVLNILP
jgi:hypothetical protein